MSTVHKIVSLTIKTLASSISMTLTRKSTNDDIHHLNQMAERDNDYKMELELFFVDF